MQSISRIFLLFLVTVGIGYAQKEEGTSATGSFPPPATTTARILGEIPDGTPTPPAPPKRKLVIPPQDILESTTHRQDGRNITIRRIEPLPLPPPPPPTPEMDPAKEAEFRSRMAEYRAKYRATKLSFLSATIYRSKNAPPRTLVRWWPQNGRNSTTFWSSADFALIAGGISSFVDSSGDTHHLFMGWGNVDMDRTPSPRAAKIHNYIPPVIPLFPLGEASAVFEGVQPDAEELAAIQSLHDLYNRNLPELRTAFEGRERVRTEREAYLKAHPPQPQDITLNYWRSTKPAVKGGKP